ncbi:glycosyltransferase [Pseudoalteromonas phenolica]|uniref:Amylovoran biosynthesis glycosyltransferase AmsE n=2 Tax=Pseudoalteromonas phenolica TaxID=161398 RepID=A0A0S2JXS3_9GAMM|nr:glycosyltransferase [Pseudoalteromonas phenolica]ALO40938.1 Amylovoran biosynthesis glycosyltransferase AmsE [Pseudoalteromonas phenolica]MBE0354539.1 alpha-1,3-rhamnosyltransferase [Pseudoalteromonas phenolica O-BC30]
MHTPDFSVLCSLYYKEQPDFLNACLESISNQTLLPSEVVIVHDGPLTGELYKVLNRWKVQLPLKEVILKENVGLGKALNIGLESCSHELVIRVDTDDINLPHRFYEQVEFMQSNPDVAVSSGHIEEFHHCPTSPSNIRKVPVQNLKVQSLKRNPINHMACIFLKSKIIAAGGYKHLMFMEDYYLWLRVLANGLKIKNLNKVLVKARTGNGMLERRRGIVYAKSELKLMKSIYKLGLTKNPIILSRFILRSGSRLLPKQALKLVYKTQRK